MFLLDIIYFLFIDPYHFTSSIGHTHSVAIKDDMYLKFNAINNLNSMFYIYIYYCIKNVKHSRSIKKRIYFTLATVK